MLTHTKTHVNTHILYTFTHEGIQTQTHISHKENTYPYMHTLQTQNRHKFAKGHTHPSILLISLTATHHLKCIQSLSLSVWRGWMCVRACGGGECACVCVCVWRGIYCLSVEGAVRVVLIGQNIFPTVRAETPTLAQEFSAVWSDGPISLLYPRHTHHY